VQAQTASRSADSVKLVRNTSSNSHNMDAAGIEVTPFGMLSHFHTKSNGDNLNVDSKELVTAVAAAAAATTATAAKAPSDSRRALKKGDRVKYVGASNAGTTGGLAVLSHAPPPGGPAIGSKGRVLMVLEDNPNKVGVRFDKPVYGGNNLVDLCEDGHGFFSNVSELRLEPPGTDMDKLVLESLFEVFCTFLTYYWTCEDVWSLHTFCCLTKCRPNHLREFSHMLEWNALWLQLVDSFLGCSVACSGHVSTCR
jgi:hypothetical protein